MEKTLIARSDRGASLNRRNEVMTKCRHRLPFFLDNYFTLTSPPTPVDEVQNNTTQPDDLQPVQLNPDPPDPLPEVQPNSQPSMSGPLTRSRSKKQQSEWNI